MFARLLGTIGLLGLLLGTTRAAVADPQDLVKQFLDELGAVQTSYTIEPITDEYVALTFPGRSFFAVWFRQWPVAVLPPNGLSAANVFIVQDDEVSYLTNPAELRGYFFEELGPLLSQDEVADAGRTWLRLSQEFSQDGYFSFSDPAVEVVSDGEDFLLFGRVRVEPVHGDRGRILVVMYFQSGELLILEELRRILRGIRPICQATKLLDPDPLVRRMAEQDLLVLGGAAKHYIQEQRTKATPELQRAIDQLWERICKEER